MDCEIDHYMVEVEDAAGRISFANDVDLRDLSEAKALARRTSAQSKNEFRAFVIAYAPNDDARTYRPVGSIGYFDRRIADRDGCLA